MDQPKVASALPRQRGPALRASLWAVPVACMLAAMLAAPLVRWLDAQTRWTLLGFGPEGAKTIVGGLASSLLTFIVFTFSILLLAAQMASQTMSPRIIARLFENRRTNVTLGAFVFAWVYCLAIAGRIEDQVPQLAVAVAMFMSMAAVGLFFWLVQFAVKGLRPGAVLIEVAVDTCRVIERLYPAPMQAIAMPRDRPDLGPVVGTLAWRGGPGMLVGFDASAIARIATQAGCQLELVPEVGDFVATGDELFRMHRCLVDAATEQALSGCVGIATERHLAQDPMFGLRIIVDVASRALSPAINDPTTAVLALDQLEHLLLVLAQRELEQGIARDATGTVRLAWRAPGWDDFVTLAVTEPRTYGAQNPQVTRRLGAMFDRLLRSVPPARAAALEAQRVLLQDTVARSYAGARDRAVAAEADLQGFGSRP